MGHVKSKTRSVGQILEKACVRSRGHIFSRILLNFGQIVCFGDFLDEWENGSYRIQNYVNRSETCTLLRGYIFSQVLLKDG